MARIAFWTIYPGGGGSEVLWNQAAEKLLKEGHSVFGSLFDSPANKRFIQNARAASMTVHLRRSGVSLAKRALRRLGVENKPGPAKELLEFRPDLIVINTDSLLWIMDDQLVETLEVSGVPYIIVIHGTGGFFEDDLRPKAQRLYANARQVCFVSEYTRQMVCRHLARDLQNCRVIRNPVNAKLDAGNPPDFPSLDGPLRFATASRLNCYTKGHDYLLQALSDSELRKQDFVCSIYNDGPHRNYIAELVGYYGLEDKVNIAGHSESITEIWRNTHVHLMPSLVESAPIALVEAMLCARPTVANKSSGIPEWVSEGENGFLVESINSWNLVPGISKAFENADRLEEMGKAAHQRAVEMMGNPLDDFFDIIQAN